MKSFSEKDVKMLEGYGFEICSKEHGFAKLRSDYCTTYIDLNIRQYEEIIYFGTVGEFVKSGELEDVIADLNNARYIASIIERKLKEEGGDK